MRIMGMILLCFFSISLFASNIENANLDKIGTFIGPDDPFPWGREAELPNNIDGIWEVGETRDGAYFIIERGTNPDTGKPDIQVHLFNPCTFDLEASGEGFVSDNGLSSFLSYYRQKMKIKISFKAFYKSAKPPLDMRRDKTQSDSEVQMVIMVMNPTTQKELDKYFPVNKISISDVVSKCETP